MVTENLRTIPKRQSNFLIRLPVLLNSGVLIERKILLSHTNYWIIKLKKCCFVKNHVWIMVASHYDIPGASEFITETEDNGRLEPGSLSPHSDGRKLKTGDVVPDITLRTSERKKKLRKSLDWRKLSYNILFWIQKPVTLYSPQIM